VYSGRELIDNKTIIKYMDISLWDTLKYNLLGVMDSVESKNKKTMDVLNDFIYNFINFIGDDCYFIYDSDGKGMNVPGVNIIKGNIQYKQFYLPEYIGQNTNMALTLFEQTCHDIELEYGHVRIQCYPSKIGSKLTLKFKDYNQYPKELPPLGIMGPDGGVSSSDNGFHVKRLINDTVDYFADERINQ
jgi:hypothetical protein